MHVTTASNNLNSDKFVCFAVTNSAKNANLNVELTLLSRTSANQSS